MAGARVSEVRAEHLLTELLTAQGWDVRRPPNGEMLRQQEYKDHRGGLAKLDSVISGFSA